MNTQLTLAKGEVVPETKSKPAKANKKVAQPQQGTQKTLAESIAESLMPPKSEPLPVLDGPTGGDGPKEPTKGAAGNLDPLLAQILQTKRCHTSTGDTNFRMWLLQWLKSNKADPKIMAEGCIVVRTDAASDTLFSCHIDTVHSLAESNGSVQKLAYDPMMEHIMLDPSEKSGCLGADDGAGIYIMLKMILGNVPGTYIFHTGEEKGGIGSRAMRAKHPELLDEFSRAIAFDRADNYEVICSQGGTPCASLEAGQDLVKALNANGLEYEISHKGTFTDTKVYAPIIPECFNLGVGYMWQHSPNEYLDVGHLERLLQACLNIQWDSLVVKRKPMGEVSQQPLPAFGGTRQSAGNFRGYEAEDREIYGQGSRYGGQKQGSGIGKPVSYATTQPKSKTPAPFSISFDDLEDYSREEVQLLVEESPENAADLICLLLARYKAKCTEAEILGAYFGG